ncbi:M20/M25/M40 family metallo-hydrolase [Streptomyces gilvus]|uniref:M20/M25/M40 family metallo-hydrolase n=1 Tax=Streptomyces gilvus TaxID=2920937 RepID=UPI001F0E3992|nr:M20/M25/M40 family metallo-hydrolase [Streptomyces sp. CME 23]MCH5674141.1 M20/M25/M40 family metallo-hydrolase [Streptomyces sp. CME 23]
MPLGGGRTGSARTAAALRHARARRPRSLALLRDLIRHPTVSADPAHRADLRACAELLAAHLRRIGLDAVTVRAGRVAPYVTGAWLRRPGAPVVLVYGHYDVQPAGPRSAWATHPFRPTVRGGYVHGRGAGDDKGQLVAQLAAIEAWLATGGPPVNLRIVLDGEEEIGSPALRDHLPGRPAFLRADLAVVSDTRMRDAHTPVLVTGLRGSLAVRLDVTGPATDLHAGAYGGAVAEPAQVLCALVASLHRPDGRVAVAGFYDDVRPPHPDTRARLARDGPTDQRFLAPAGLRYGHGEPGHSAFERATVRPAVVVTALQAAARAAVPHRARADLGIRLVPGQRPATVFRALSAHLAQRVPRGVRARLTPLFSCGPYRMDLRDPSVAAASRATTPVFGRPPLLLPSGGSIPFVGDLAATAGTRTLLLGFGLPDDNIHAPDERFALSSLHRGTDTCVRLYGELGAL